MSSLSSSLRAFLLFALLTLPLWALPLGCDVRRPGINQEGTEQGGDGGSNTERAGIERVNPPEQPPTEQPTTEQPPTEQPPTEQPPTEQPPTEQPLTEQPSTEQPPTEQPPTEPTPEMPSGTACQGAGTTNYSDILLEMKNRRGYIQIPIEQASVCITGAACQESCAQTDTEGRFALQQIPHADILRWEWKHPDFDTVLFYATHEAIQRHRLITNPFFLPRKQSLVPFFEPVAQTTLDPAKGILLYFLGQDGAETPNVKLSTANANGPHITQNFFSVNGFYVNVDPGAYTLEALVDAKTFCLPEIAEGIARDNTAQLRIEAGKITYVAFLCKTAP
jgi:hypothetical protein